MMPNSGQQSGTWADQNQGQAYNYPQDYNVQVTTGDGTSSPESGRMRAVAPKPAQRQAVQDLDRVQRSATGASESGVARPGVRTVMTSSDARQSLPDVVQKSLSSRVLGPYLW